jgi:hypothetical protein
MFGPNFIHIFFFLTWSWVEDKDRTDLARTRIRDVFLMPGVHPLAALVGVNMVGLVVPELPAAPLPSNARIRDRDELYLDRGSGLHQRGQRLMLDGVIFCCRRCGGHVTTLITAVSWLFRRRAVWV